MLLKGSFDSFSKTKIPHHWKKLNSSVLTSKRTSLIQKMEPFQYLRTKEEARMKVSNNSVLDLIALLTQKIDQMNTQFVQVQNQLMNRMITVERNQSTPDLSLPDNREIPQVGNQGLSKRRRPQIL
jgi:hypothetical protein